MEESDGKWYTEPMSIGQVNSVGSSGERPTPDIPSTRESVNASLPFPADELQQLEQALQGRAEELLTMNEGKLLVLSAVRGLSATAQNLIETAMRQRGIGAYRETVAASHAPQREAAAASEEVRPVQPIHPIAPEPHKWSPWVALQNLWENFARKGEHPETIALQRIKIENGNGIPPITVKFERDLESGTITIHCTPDLYFANVVLLFDRKQSAKIMNKIAGMNDEDQKDLAGKLGFRPSEFDVTHRVYANVEIAMREVLEALLQ